MTAVLERLLRPGGRRRSPSDFFAHADRLRREGRYPEAATLVASGLALDPNSVTGHLLAAYLHVAQRTIEPAKREFRWVLGRDASHPRALLGLARIALEEGDLVGCRECLVQRAARLPRFPGSAARSSTRSPPRRRAPRRPRRHLGWSGCGCPGPRARSCSSTPRAGPSSSSPAAEDGGPRLPRIAGLASAALKRAGFGPLRRAIIDDREQTHFLRADGVHTLALAMPRTTPIPQGLLEVNRLWGAAQHELAVARDEAPVPPPGSIRRVS